MTKLLNLLQVAIALILVSGCNTASSDSQSDAAAEKSKSFDLPAAKSAIAGVNQKFMEAFKKGDSASIAALYASDGKLMPPNSEVVKSADIASAWGSFMRMGIKELKLVTDEIFGNEEIISESGRYEIYGDGNKLWDNGKYVVVWKEENGDWKLYHDIWNSNMPAAPAK